ncbi:hypothetical protein [Dactylosporangium sp. NPDC005555]|uniref:hypothetical protein n=1 Tax=Dactylosporangium sp. NPDC005555 TaxID=3154889 RepID=UPI0033AA2B34
MTAADRLAEALLRFAARRWPASVREEQSREWSAELHALRTEPGAGAGRRALGQLRFAFSLAAASPVDDEDGVPRGWREGLPEAGRALQPLAALTVFGVLAAGPGAGILRTVSEWLLGLAGVPIRWPAGIAVTLATSLPALLILTAAAWWLGRRLPVRRHRGLASASALSVAFAVLVVGTVTAVGPGAGSALALSLAIGAPAWALLTAALTLAVVRLAARPRHRWPAAVLALAGIPVVVELAVTAAVLPWVLTSGADLSTALNWAPSLLSGTAVSGDAGTWHQSAEAIALSNATNTYPSHLLVLTGLAIGHGLGAARPRPVRRPAPQPVHAPAPLRLPPAATAAGVVSLRPSPAAPGAGVVSLVAGLFAWAYTLAVLTPAMPLVGRTAPMPGGDGELYMWVAELRWGGITLAALGLLLAAADRRAAPLAAAAQTVALLIVDGVLARAETTDLRTALTAAAITAAVSWLIAGTRPAAPAAADGLLTRRRLAWTSVIAACCGPVLFGQGTPEVNHPFLPPGLAGVTALLAATLAVVAAQAAAAARPTRLRPAWSAAVTAVPALLLGGLGLATGAGVSNTVTSAGFLLTVPMILLVVATMRAHRPSQGWSRPTLWVVLSLTSPVLSVAVVAVSLMLSMVTANVLFAVAGSSWAADGMSFLPGTVVLAVAIGVAVSRTVIRATEPPTGHPAPPDLPPAPQPTQAADLATPPATDAPRGPQAAAQHPTRPATAQTARP